MARRRLARLGAPVAFLLGVTIAVLLVRSGLEHGTRTARTSTTRPVTHASTAAGGTAPRQASTARTATTPAGAGRYYTVRKGDTFGSIAAKEGTTVTALESLNPGVSSTSLQVGQKIRVK
jgi:LysM repeat protein